MNHKRIIIVNLLLLFIMRLSGQTVAFTYDDNGNRKSRILVVEIISPPGNPNPRSFEYSMGSSKTDKALVSDQVITDKVLDSDKAKEEKLVSEEDKTTIVVYPNPNKGLIKIDISNIPLNSLNELRVYDLSGFEIMVKKNIGNHTEIDINRYKDGIYILRVMIDNKIYDWKVVKNR